MPDLFFRKFLTEGVFINLILLVLNAQEVAEKSKEGFSLSGINLTLIQSDASSISALQIFIDVNIFGLRSTLMKNAPISIKHQPFYSRKPNSEMKFISLELILKQAQGGTQIVFLRGTCC